MRRCPTRARDDELSEAVRVPGFHRGSLVGSRESGEHGITGLDLGKIAFDDLDLSAGGTARYARLTPVGAIGPTVRSMDSQSRSTDFVALGHAGSERYAGLETFANPGVSQVEMTSDELTAVCPVTAQPDLYVATIEYWPQALCIESKSLKLYLNAFRNEAGFCEALAVRIRDDVAKALELSHDKVRVTLKQKPRGGITITATS